MSKTLEEIIKERRTIRNFTGDMPSEQDIKDIAAAAVYAPFGGATGIPLSELRKIFIFKQGSAKMQQAKELVINEVKKNSKKLNLVLKILPFLRKKMGSFANRLKNISENGIPALEKAGYYIIVAEKKGFPPVEKQSIAHAMQNMWLMATHKGLGFQMLSATGIMSKNELFTKLLGLKEDEYEIDGCVIGIPVINIESAKPKSLDVDSFINWIQ